MRSIPPELSARLETEGGLLEQSAADAQLVHVDGATEVVAQSHDLRPTAPGAWMCHLFAVLVCSHVVVVGHHLK